MTDEQPQSIWDFVHAGGVYLSLHNAQALYPPDGLYDELFGGDYETHPRPYFYTVRVEDRQHPITARVQDFEIFDEQHIVQYYLDHSQLLLRSISRDNLESPAGWW